MAASRAQSTFPSTSCPTASGNCRPANSCWWSAKWAGRSSQATAFLREHGFEAVNLAGGMVEWAAAHRAMLGDAAGAPLVV